MKKYAIIILSATLSLLAGCDEIGNSFMHAIGVDNHKYYSVIYEYYAMNMGEIESSPEGIVLTIDSRLDNVVARAYPTCCNSPIYDEALAKRHRTLSEKYGDIHEPWWESDKSFDGLRAIEDAFVSIDITSDSEYDSNHPAGTSLASLFRIKFRYLLPYTHREPIMYEDSINKCVAELTPTELTLINYLNNDFTFWFSFITPPTSAQQHNFTITFTSDEGVIYSYDCFVDFEEQEAV